MKLNNHFVVDFGRFNGTFVAARAKPGDQVDQIAAQLQNFFFRQIQAAYDVLANAKSQFSHVEPLGAKPDLDFAFVFEAAFARDKVHGLKAFHQRRQGSGVEHQRAAKLGDIQTVPFPKHGQHDVLRVRQAHRPEPLAVGFRHRARRCIKSETQLIVEFQKTVPAVVGHGLTFLMRSVFSVSHGMVARLRPIDLGLLKRLAALWATFI